jgi:hypothetical protein
MNWEATVLVLGVLASGVGAWALWLRQRGLEVTATAGELTRRLDRLEGEVRSAKMGAPAPAVPVMGVWGAKR